MKNTFTGPLFIVGMPRSGTKLLRGALNSHSQISIPGNESKIIPYFLERHQLYGDLRDEERFRRFYREFASSSFFLDLSRNGFAPSPEEWQKLIIDGRMETALGALLTFYCHLHGKSVWGDKTPGYERHVLLLRQAYPTSKFICMWRDPRDCVLSSRKAWQKDIGRVAQRWNESYKAWRGAISQIPTDAFLEVHFEQLVDHPESVLNNIQRFLHLPEENLLDQIKKSTENLGAARGKIGVVKGNYGKWIKDLNRREILLVEGLAYEGMEALGYAPSLAKAPRRINSLGMRFRQLRDGLSLFRFHTRRRGLITGSKHFIMSYLHSASRIRVRSDRDVG